MTWPPRSEAICLKSDHSPLFRRTAPKSMVDLRPWTVQSVTVQTTRPVGSSAKLIARTTVPAALTYSLSPRGCGTRSVPWGLYAAGCPASCEAQRTRAYTALSGGTSVAGSRCRRGAKTLRETARIVSCAAARISLASSATLLLQPTDALDRKSNDDNAPL
jgi:hypothetical protein